jgi:hypothetical protein
VKDTEFGAVQVSPTCTILLTSTCTTVLSGAALNAPTENVVVLISFASEKNSEKFVLVKVLACNRVRGPGVVEEDSNFAGVASVKEIGGVVLCLYNATVFLLLGKYMST